MLQFTLNKKEYKKLLIILKNMYTIHNNKDALNLYSDIKRQGGL